MFSHEVIVARPHHCLVFVFQRNDFGKSGRGRSSDAVKCRSRARNAHKYQSSGLTGSDRRSIGVCAQVNTAARLGWAGPGRMRRARACRASAWSHLAKHAQEESRDYCRLVWVGVHRLTRSIGRPFLFGHGRAAVSVVTP